MPSKNRSKGLKEPSRKIIIVQSAFIKQTSQNRRYTWHPFCLLCYKLLMKCRGPGYEKKTLEAIF